MPLTSQAAAAITLRPVFDGRVLLVSIAGDRARSGLAWPVLKIAVWLRVKGVRDLVLDLREAYYPPERADAILARLQRVKRLLPRCRVALLHRDEDPIILNDLIDLARRSGDIIEPVRSMQQARAFLLGETAGEED